MNVTCNNSQWGHGVDRSQPVGTSSSADWRRIRVAVRSRGLPDSTILFQAHFNGSIEEQWS